MSKIAQGDTMEDVRIVSKRVNGGTNGLEERKKFFVAIYKALRDL